MLMLLGACVDLGPPGQVGSTDTSGDLVRPEDVAGSGDKTASHDALMPVGDVSPSGEVAPPADADPPLPEPRPADGAVPVDAPDVMSPPPDAGPPDLPRDLSPDLPPDLPIDRPPDVTVDLPVAVMKGICPAGESALLLCLRFENTLADDSAPAAAVTGTISYEPGPGDTAGRVGPASVVRVSQGWGTVGGSFTLEAWVRPDRLPSGAQRMGLLDEESHFGLFILPGGTLACYSAGTGVSVTNAVNVGQWSAVACTAGGGALTAWVNGVQRSQVSLGGGAGGTTANLAIGSNNPSGDTFEGLMDNVRVWNTVRTGPQICQAALGCQ